MRKIIAALPLAAMLMLPVACGGSGHPAWCGQTIALTIAWSDAPNQVVRVDATYADKLSRIVSGAVLGGSLQSSGKGTAQAVVLTVPADFPALIRRDAASFNHRGDQFLLLPLGYVWSTDYRKQCR